MIRCCATRTSRLDEFGRKVFGFADRLEGPLSDAARSVKFDHGFHWIFRRCVDRMRRTGKLLGLPLIFHPRYRHRPNDRIGSESI